MINRDDWLCPAAFVNRIDLTGREKVVVRSGMKVIQADQSKICAYVNASHQSGNSITIDPLWRSLEVGSVIIIDRVLTWSRVDNVPLDIPRELIVTAKAEIGHTVLHVYPPVIGKEDPCHRTVVDLPMSNAVVREVLSFKYAG